MKHIRRIFESHEDDKRYLDMNPPKGFSVSRAGNSIQLRRL